MNKKKLKKSRDEFIKCAIRAKKNNNKEKEKQFLDMAATLNNLCD